MWAGRERKTRVRTTEGITDDEVAVHTDRVHRGMVSYSELAQ